jgi:hypothetical protein
LYVGHGKNVFVNDQECQRYELWHKRADLAQLVFGFSLCAVVVMAVALREIGKDR